MPTQTITKANQVDAEYAGEYERLAKDHWWWQSRSRFVFDLIESLTLPGSIDGDARILDIGCGGGWSFELWERFGEVYGVELDPTLVARAGKFQPRIHCGPFDREFQPESKFSLIVMLDVLEHLPDPEVALAYALELLRPGGKIVITVPAMPSLWTSHDDLNHHYVRYTKRSLQSLGDSCGMEIEKLDYLFHWTTLAKAIVRMKEALVETEPQSPSIPGPYINAFFRNLCLAEQRMFRYWTPPLGTSLVCVGSVK